MNGKTDGAALVRDGAGDRLSDPPGGVGGELVALLVIELLSRTDQAEAAFLNQILEAQASVHVLLGDRDHQAQVRLHHFFLGPTPQHQPASETDHRHLHQSSPFLGVGMLAVVAFELCCQLLEMEQVGDLARQFNLFVRPQQTDPADLLQVNPDGVFGVDPLRTDLDAGQGLGFGLLFRSSGLRFLLWRNCGYRLFGGGVLGFGCCCAGFGAGFALGG